MKNDRPTAVSAPWPRWSAGGGAFPATEPADAMDDPVRGYEEATQLYTRLRDLTWKQRMALRDGQYPDRFGDLLEEMRSLLRLIAETETRLRAAKSAALSRNPPQHPSRFGL